MPADWCPFCPGSGNVPDNYDVYLYPNDFPAFSLDSEPFDPKPGLFSETGARGTCDVVLYSPEHTLPPSKLSLESWRKVVDLWTLRTAELSKNPDIAFVAPFENCGEAVGVTMPHPHGQIYSMPFVPFLTEKELASSAEFAAKNQGDCIYCRLLDHELSDSARVVAQNEHFVAFVPFAARFPAEIAIYSRRHLRTLIDLEDAEKQSLAALISVVRKKYDNLYGFLMPLMMTVQQGPLRDTAVPYHFHVQFQPLQRSATKLKYLASIETGFGTFLADTSPEEMAENLRKA
jgi:UDPglucose--hexose-1-phosphate uridylyltransferase